MTKPDSLQFNSNHQLQHLLSIEGLNQALLTEIMDNAESFASLANQPVKKYPILRGKTIVNLFFISFKSHTFYVIVVFTFLHFPC